MQNSLKVSATTKVSNYPQAFGVTTLVAYVEWLREMAAAQISFEDLSGTMALVTYNNNHNFMMWDVGYKI